MQSARDTCGVSVFTLSTCVLKYPIFSRILWFLLGETINLLLIPHMPMKFDDSLTHFQILFETTSGASETMCTKVC